MKKLLIILALFFWALILGEILNVFSRLLPNGEGILQTLLTQDLNDARLIAALVARVVVFAMIAATTVIFTLPTVLYLRRRKPLVLSSLCAALVPCLIWGVVEFVGSGGFKEDAYKGFVFLFGQGFPVAFAGARFWPVRQQDIEEVPE